ncbi:MAG: phenylalanine--tRNA ligase subunit beta [Alphaproteobacteria bacterium]|nr:phenylalanine--tRNA ligase subunit beta [Alphaproteobacteria bacterium]
MKFTLGWLKEHLDTDASLEEITDKLTALGLELEGVENPAEKFAPFKVTYVESAEKHPDADRLKVCIVDTGSEKLQVVCGAPNAKAGMKGIFAPAGSYVPGTDMVLKKGVIRGQESNGMLVSEREMGLSDEHEGIIELPEDTEIGTAFADIFGMDDPVIDIAVTPNRADCAGVRGIARDLAAGGLGTLKPLDTTPVKGNYKSSVGIKITAKEQCPLFLGRMVKGVKNGQSPTWMQERLKAVGLRPISALVDITNYMSIDLCRPLHVYDVAKLKGDIDVRLSKAGESFEALNDKSYTLSDGMTAIMDESGVLGLGGIVGGVSTGCTEETTDVLIECAYFDPYAIAKTGRALQIESDARYRFERGVDPAFTIKAMEIATRLVMDICGGEASEVVQAGEVPDFTREIDFDPAYTKKLSGMDVAEKRQTEILESLGFTVKAGKVTPPTWRGDVAMDGSNGKADLVEEIIRVEGYDKLEAIPVRSDHAISTSAETLNAKRMRKTRTALAARGLSECVTWSFMPKKLAAYFGSNDNALTLTNPISSDLDQMRPSILGNLIQAAGGNAAKGLGYSYLFEVGPVFTSSKVDGQLSIAAGIRTGSAGPRHWSGAEVHRAIDIYDAKADAFAALEAAGAPTGNLQTARSAPDYFHPGRSATLSLGKNVLAQFGEIHPAILEEMDIKGPVCGFEVFLDNIPAGKTKGPARKLLEMSQFQPVNRDFAFIVDEMLEVDTLVRAIKGVERNLITDVSVFDVYQGKGVEEGKKSVALNVVLQPTKQTLTDAEIESISTKIIDIAASKVGATLRA